MNTKTVRSLQEIRDLFSTNVLSPAEQADIISANVAAAKHIPDRAQRIETLNGLRELGINIPTQSQTSERSTPRPQVGMDALAKKYIANAVSSLTRVPSEKLKSDFRAKLAHWRQLIIMALKTTDEPTALVNVTMAIVEAQGSWDALRMLRNIGGQLLWQASIDIARDRRS